MQCIECNKNRCCKIFYPFDLNLFCKECVLSIAHEVGYPDKMLGVKDMFKQMVNILNVKEEMDCSHNVFGWNMIYCKCVIITVVLIVGRNMQEIIQEDITRNKF